MRILKKLIGSFHGTKRQADPVIPALPLGEVPISPGKVKERPAAHSIIAALRCNDMFAAKRQLREWWIGLHRERLPSGDCWVIGGYFFYFDFQWPLVEAISDAFEGQSNLRIFVGRTAFWRAASLELWETRQIDELYRRLRGALIVYDPQVYLIWARVLVCSGRSLEAGRYFLFSGLYDESESEFVSQFKRTLARARPNEILGRMPGPCITKRARRQFPPRVYEDLASVPSPDWLRRRPAQLTWMTI